MGERTETKGFLYFNDIGGSFDPSRCAPEFIETRAPCFVLYETGEEFIEHVAQDGIDPQAPWNRGDYIRVRGCDPEEARLIKTGYPQIQVEVTREVQEEERRIDKEALTSDRTLLKSYIEEMSVNDLDADRLLSLGLELLVED